MTERNIFEQGLLRYLTEEQLDIIQSVRIGIGGAGGLGSNVAMLLVRTGFRNLVILDCDTIDPSNLNRQQYFTNEIGLSKAPQTKKRLLDINPDADITAIETRWVADTPCIPLDTCPYIIEAFDQTASKHAFVEYYCSKAEYVISGIGMAGLTEKKEMTVRRAGNIFIVGDQNTDTASGHPPMAPRVTACAARMAEIVLDLTLNLPMPYLGKR